MPSFEKDLQKLNEQLGAHEVFSFKQHRHHKGYQKHKQLIMSINWKKVQAWAKQQILNYDTNIVDILLLVTL